MFRQFELVASYSIESKSAPPVTRTDVCVCWLPDASNLREGARLRLKKDVRLWRITKRYETTLLEPPDKTWKVGGLL